MKEFFCSRCREIETVSENTTRMMHKHGDLHFELKELQGAPVDSIERQSRLFIKELQLIEFDPEKIYFILFNPVDIDILKVMKNLESQDFKIKVDCLFVPCKFTQSADGYQTEMIAIESLDIIEEWLKERKAAIKEFCVPSSTK